MATMMNPSAACRAPRRLLVIDDDVAIGAALRRALAADADVVVDGDALSAIARLDRGEPFDLILCDVRMPGMLGTDFVRFVRRYQRGAARAVVLMTGGAPPTDLAVECLTKPLDLDLVRAMLAVRARAEVAARARTHRPPPRTSVRPPKSAPPR